MTRSLGAKRNKEDSEEEDRRDRKRVARGDTAAVEPGQSNTEQCATNHPTPRMAGLKHSINQEGSQFDGKYNMQAGASLQQGNIVNIQQTADRCLADLRVTDPRHDKKRIQDTKGGLLRDAYVWVLENLDFCQWRDNQDQRLLWVKGDPGKGKTMLLCGIVDHLQTPPAEGRRLAYFFCQATDERINTATAVLRGLVYMLLDQDPSLVSHMKKKYDAAGKALFEDTNAWQALSEVFTNMLHDPKLQGVCLVVDALDECVTGLGQLLDLITQTSRSTSAKWLVSSRNWPQIEEQLSNVAQRLSLELNAESVSAAVGFYIKHKVKELAKEKKYNPKTKRHVVRYLSSHANGTFLWAALVCQELKAVPELDARIRVKTFPPGLDTLYQRIMEKVCMSTFHERCHRFLALTAMVYRPLSLFEYVSFFEELNYASSEAESDDSEWDDSHSEDTNLEESKPDLAKSVRELVSLCGSFLMIREDTVYFVHQSAKDFLIDKQSSILFPKGQAALHSQITTTSIEAMSQTLKRDIYGLRDPGFCILEGFTRPIPDPLAKIGYSCLYWVHHLVDSDINPDANGNVQDGGTIDKFLQSKCLYWIESLSLLRSVSEGMLAVERLNRYLQEQSRASRLQALVHDAYRLLQSFRLGIESWPLQTYASALVFSPTQSLIRWMFRHEEPQWVKCRTGIAEQWSACVATLEGHTSFVNSAAFSADGQRVVSASHDKTVKVWDAATGACVQTLEGHTFPVNSAAFSADGQRVVSASWDHTVKVWDAATGGCVQTLEGHTFYVNSAAFSADGQRVVSASSDKTVKVWDAATGACVQTLEGHTYIVNSAAFSADGQRVVSASWDNTVKVWDAATGACVQTLEGHTFSVNSAAFSADGQRVVSASSDDTVKVWDAATGACLGTYKVGRTSSVSFDPTGTHVHTDAGDIRVDEPLPSHPDAHITRPAQRKDYGLSPDGVWVVKQSRPVLWLPWEYRPSCSAVVAVEGGTNVVLGYSSGRVCIFHFALS